MASFSRIASSSSMASFFIFSLLFLLNFSTTLTSAIEINFSTFNISPTPSPSSKPPPPPLPSLSVIARPPPSQFQETPQQLQFSSIIDSIVGAGDFSNWVDPSIFPLTATLFVPVSGKSTTCPASYRAFLAGNSTSPVTSFDQVVPRRFTFTELRQFPTGARLPTLLPGKTLLITDNSAGNFSVNGALLTHPDLFQSSVVSVHGIGTVLDYDTFGDDLSLPGNFLGRNSSSENMLGEFPSPPLPKLAVAGHVQILQADLALILCTFALILVLYWQGLMHPIVSVLLLICIMW